MSSFFSKLLSDLDVSGLQHQLSQHPHLWHQNDFRTGYRGSPFSTTSDIWLRYRAAEQLQEPKNYLEPHTPVFYPTWLELTEVWPYVRLFMSFVGATELGGILITRKPPGAVVPLHSDGGSWHAEHMDAKIWMTISGPESECLHIGGGEEITMKSGEAWTFNNLLPHAVINKSDQDQITLIVSMRSPDGNFLRMKE